MPDPNDRTQVITARIATGEIPVAELREAPPSHRQRDAARRDKRAWSRHWLIPVSVGLAIVYWIYLYRTVVRPKEVDLKIVAQAPASDQAQKALYLRPPSDEYTITEVRDADGNKVFDTENNPVRLRIVAPGNYVAHVDSALRLLVDIPPPQTSLAHYTHDFTAADVKDLNNDQLTPFIREMTPSRLRVKVELSSNTSFELTSKRVRILWPAAGDWQKRAFTDSLTFKPTFAMLRGPKAELDQLGDDKEIFTMNLQEELPKLEGRSDQGLATAELSLLQNLREKGIKASSLITASIRVAPRPSVLKDYRVPVIADWLGAPLQPADFAVDSEAAVEITSYNAELTRLLSDRPRGERWVRENLRGLVSLGELDPALDFTTADFQSHLDPDWWCKDRNYVLDRDLVVVKKSLIAVKRRSP